MWVAVQIAPVALNKIVFENPHAYPFKRHEFGRAFLGISCESGVCDMIESSSVVEHDRSTSSLVPIVGLAATAQGDNATSRASTAWGLRVRPKKLGAADYKGSHDSWFQVLKEKMKTLAYPRDGTWLAPRRLLKFENHQQSRLGPEITALQREVAEMREELRDAQEQEKSARYLAFHDDLTALPNRRCFRERLERALAAGREQPPVLAVIYLDLDGFKALNDAYV
jgi:hypothetical protein